MIACWGPWLSPNIVSIFDQQCLDMNQNKPSDQPNQPNQPNSSNQSTNQPITQPTNQPTNIIHSFPHSLKNQKLINSLNISNSFSSKPPLSPKKTQTKPKQNIINKKTTTTFPFKKNPRKGKNKMCEDGVYLGRD